MQRRLGLNWLSETPPTELLAVLNGDPSGVVTHWCHGPTCCTDGAHALQKCLQLVSSLFSRAPPVPLLYRWKGFEECCAWAIRGSIHNLLAQALAAIRQGDSAADTTAPVVDAKSAAAAGAGTDAAADAIDLGVSPALVQSVRSASVCAFFMSDTAMAKLSLLQLTAAPFEHVSNILFADANARAEGDPDPDTFLSLATGGFGAQARGCHTAHCRTVAQHVVHTVLHTAYCIL